MKINEDFEIAVIGAGIAGLTSAIYTKRAGASVIVLDGKGYGGQISSTDRVENYPGFKSISGFDLSTAVYEQAKELGVKIKFSSVNEVIKTDTGFTVATAKIVYKVKAVVIATGLEKRKLGIKGEDALIGKGVSYCATCDGAFYKNKAVAVIGGGNTALEDALYLSAYCSKVYLVHRRNEYRGEQAYIDKVNENTVIAQLKSYVPTEIVADDAVTSLKVKNLESYNIEDIKVDGVFVAVGQIPSNELFKRLVDVDENGYIIADESCETSCKGVFVAGDCRTKEVRQLVTAAADGAVAGIKAAKFIRA